MLERKDDLVRPCVKPSGSFADGEESGDSKEVAMRESGFDASNLRWNFCVNHLNNNTVNIVVIRIHGWVNGFGSRGLTT